MGGLEGPPAERRAPRPVSRTDKGPPRPWNVTITETRNDFTAVYRWFSWLQVLLTVGALVAAPLAMRFLPPRIGSGLAMLLVAVASYIALVTLFNRTTLRATREAVSATHGPVPVVGGNLMDPFGFWPDVRNVWVATAKLMWIAKGERELMDLSARGDGLVTKVYLRAVFHDGAGMAEVQLLPSLASPAVEDYVGAHLDRWLQGADLPIYRGADLSEPE